MGLAGQSLHYLVEGNFFEANFVEGNGWAEKLGLVEAGGESTEIVVHETSVGIHHCHGPDYHVHYHRVREPQPKAAEPSRVPPAVVDRSVKRSVATGTTFQEPGQPHEPHACPLLGVVSTLKLGQGGLLTWSLEVSVNEIVESDPRQRPEQEFSRLNLARGPPSSRIL